VQAALLATTSIVIRRKQGLGEGFGGDDDDDGEPEELRN